MHRAGDFLGCCETATSTSVPFYLSLYDTQFMRQIIINKNASTFIIIIIIYLFIYLFILRSKRVTENCLKN